MNGPRLIALTSALAVVAAAGIVMVADRPVAQAATNAALTSSADGYLPPLVGATGWLNGKPLMPADLRGKVVLVDFWTFTCINWQRTAPYVRAWAAKYADAGLVVVGVHSPEFAFEADAANVTRATRAMRIDYPVAIDSDFAIWRAFGNRYWPAVYLVGPDGRIRYRHFGEGGTDETEHAIQRLLAEAGASDVPRDLVAVDARGSEAAADWDDLRTAETYVGFAGSASFASRGGLVRGRASDYTIPSTLALNHWAFAGRWNVGDNARTDAAGTRIAFRFHARDLHLVMGPISARPVHFRVRIDGQPPGPSHGGDVDADGAGAVDVQRLYQLVRQTGDVRDRLFEIEFLDPGVEAYAFTFG